MPEDQDYAMYWYINQNKRAREITNPRRPLIADQPTAAGIDYTAPTTRPMPQWARSP